MCSFDSVQWLCSTAHLLHMHTLLTIELVCVCVCVCVCVVVYILKMNHDSREYCGMKYRYVPSVTTECTECITNSCFIVSLF